MRQQSGQVKTPLFLFLFFAFFVLLVLVGYSVQDVSIVIIAILVFVAAFLNIDFALLILVFSMLLSPELTLAHMPERDVVLRFDDIFLVVVFFGWMAKMALNKELGMLRKTSLNLPIVSFILVYLISTGLGVFSGTVTPLKGVFYLLKYVEYFLLYFMVSNVIRSKQQVKLFLSCLLLVCVITCLYANVTLAQFGRATSPFDREANTLGGYLVFILGVTGGLFLYNRSSQRQLVLLGIIGLAIWTLMHTLNRGGYVAFFAVILALLVLTRRRKHVLVIVSLLALLLVPQLLPQKVTSRVRSTFVKGHVYSSKHTAVPLDDSATARLVGLDRVFQLWKTSPLFGYGATGVGFTDMQYALVLGETGIVGSVVFLWLLLKIFGTSMAVFKKEEGDWEKGLALGLMAALAGILVHSFSANSFIIIRIMEPFWFVTAIVVALPYLDEPRESGA
jgi:hypothetical protein